MAGFLYRAPGSDRGHGLTARFQGSRFRVDSAQVQIGLNYMELWGV